MKKQAMSLAGGIVLLFLAAFYLGGCETSADTTATTKNTYLTQKETQTIETVKSDKGDTLTASQTMAQEKFFPLQCQQLDDIVQKELDSGKYTWKKPKVMLNPYGDAPLSAYILFTTNKAYQIRVTVKGKTAATNVSGVLSKTKKHRIPVIGLYAGTNNKVVLETLNAKGKTLQKKTVRIKTAKLDSRLKDAIHKETIKVKTVKKVKKKNGKTKKKIVYKKQKSVHSAYGLTIISGNSTKCPFAYDEDGNIRWYITYAAGSYGFFPLSNKRFMYQTYDSLTPTEEKAQTTEMMEMDFMGRAYQIYFVRNGIHHEIIEKTPGGNLLVLSSSINQHIEDVVVEIDRKTGREIKALDMQDVFDDTYVNKTDWAHLNTVSYDKEEDAILLSPRNLHAAVKVDWKTNKIKWIIAHPDMFKGTEQEGNVLTPKGDITWHFQPHSIYEIPYDLDKNPDTVHVMVYDNHWQTKRKVKFFDGLTKSNVLVYVVNEKKKTVKQVNVFTGVRSIITSNCAYNKKKNRMFSFGGYLYPLVKGRKGMVYEFDYKTGKTLNQYSTKEYFYRGYEMKIGWKGMEKPMKKRKDYVKGALQGPIAIENNDIPEAVIAEDKVSFVRKETLLYVNANDHTIDRVRFVGKNNTYRMDYRSAGKGMESKRNQRYSVAIPLSGMKPDTYEILVHYDGTWYATGKNVVRNN